MDRLRTEAGNMARAFEKAFTVTTIKKDVADGKYADKGCRGLYLWVRGASRTWQFRYNRDGIANTLSLGSLAHVGLADARSKADTHRGVLASGGDPKVRKAEVIAAANFREDTQTYFKHVNRTWRSDTYRADWLASMERHVFPHIGDKPTIELTVGDIVKVIEPLWGVLTKADVILDRVRLVIDHAIDNDDADRFKGNPADRVKSRLPKGVQKDVAPHPALPWEQAPALYRKLTAMPDCQAAKALRLLLLCCTPRANEIIEAQWSEIKSDVFSVPAERMKSGKARVIPLSQGATNLLATMEHTDGYLFPGRKGKHIGGIFVAFKGHIQKDAMQLLLQELAPGYHVHGMRSTFRTWVSDHAMTVKDHDCAELCLDHVIGNRVQRAYDRADMVCERRELAERWAQYLMG
jgi:integrase